MPPLRLTSLLQAELPHVSVTGRAVLSTLACCDGDPPPADEVAAWVGLRDRHQLRRWLRRDGLPPLRRLAAWARVLYWMLEADSNDSSLVDLARRDGLDPAVAYRLVHRVTGQRWSEARQAGLAATLSRFHAQCRRRSVGRYRAVERVPPLAADKAVMAPFSTLAPVTAQHPAAVLAERLPVSGSPFDVAIDRDGTAYITRAHAAALECLRMEPFRSIASVPTGAVPTAVVLWSSGHEAFVTTQFAEDVAIIDLSVRQQVGAIAVPGQPLGAALSVDGRTLYVTTNRDQLCAISVRLKRVFASVPIPQACTAIGVHPSGRWVYVPTWRAGLVLEMSASTLQITRRFDVGGIAQDTVVSTDGLMLYVANQGGWLDALHLPSGRSAARVQFGTAALSLAQSPDGAVLYTGLLFAGRVAQIDRATLQVLGSLETGGRPRRIAFDPTGRTALIANEAGWVDLVH